VLFGPIQKKGQHGDFDNTIVIKTILVRFSASSLPRGEKKSKNYSKKQNVHIKNKKENPPDQSLVTAGQCYCCGEDGRCRSQLWPNVTRTGVTAKKAGTGAGEESVRHKEW